MSGIVAIGDPARVLLVRQDGMMTASQRRVAVEEVVRRAQALNCYRILVDYRQAHLLERDLALSAFAADFIADAFRGQDARVAALVRFDHQLDATLEVMLTERGIAVRRFHELDTAMTWVQANPPSASVERRPAQRTAADPVAIAIRAVEPDLALLPSQFAALVHLVSDLVLEGFDETRIAPIARRLARSFQREPMVTASPGDDHPGHRPRPRRPRQRGPL